MKKKIAENKLISANFLFWLFLIISNITHLLPINSIIKISAIPIFLLHGMISYLAYTCIYSNYFLGKRAFSYWLFFISIGIFINDLIFYLFVYFPKNDLIQTSSAHLILISTPYFLWVLPLIIMLSKIIIQHMDNKNKFYKNFCILLLIDFIIVYCFFTFIYYDFDVLSLESISQIIKSITGIILFALSVFCLIYSANTEFSSILEGFAFLISSYLMINYPYLTQNNAIQIYGFLLWFGGLLFISSGIFSLRQDKHSMSNEWLRGSIAIRRHLSFWIFVISTSSILPFFILLYYCLPVKKTIFLILPPAIIIIFGIKRFFSSIIGKKIETHFEQIACNIKNLMLDKKNIVQFNFSIDEFAFLQNFINDIYKLKEAKDKTKKRMGEISAQLAHDIRSPLFVLKTILTDSSHLLPERQRIDAFNAIQRVTDIANNVLSQYRDSTNSFLVPVVKYTSEPIAVILESIASEKRIQTTNTNIGINLLFEPHIYNAFVHINIIEFKRVISNIINNAIDACSDIGIINIQLNKKDEKIILVIEDNGCGISEEKLKTLLEQGGTFDKKNGFGLGLPYAMSKIIEWHGEYSLNSIVDKGTQFKIILNEEKPAEWFCHQISLLKKSTIIILDDDEHIHQIWDNRLSENFLLDNHLTILHFTDPEKLISAFQSKPIENTVFLLDYELGKNKLKGLEVVQRLAIAHCSTLVTSRYEDDKLRKKCEILTIKIIPKFFAEIIPIKVYSPTEIVLIDDEEMIGYYWKKSAEKHGKSISVFKNPDDFIKIAHYYDKGTIIYIDSSLGKSMQGEDIAKILHERGYEHLILATGYPKSRFSEVTWIKDVVGKEPPWNK